MSDGNTNDKAAQIAAIKARMAKMKAGGDAAPAAGGAGGAPAAGGAGQAAAAAPAGEDMAARIAALKAKVEATKGQTAPAAAASAPAKKKPSAAGAAKNVYPVQPINRTTFGEERLYEPNTLNKWFILGGLALTISVLAMWARDHQRDWKHYQEEHRLLELVSLGAEVKAAQEAVDPEALATVTSQIAAAEQVLAGHQAQLEDLQERKLELDGRYYGANQQFQIRKAELDAMRFSYEEKRLTHGGDAELMADSDEELAALQTEVEQATAKADAAKLELDVVDGEIKALEANLTEGKRMRADLLARETRLQTSVAKIEPGIFNDWVRNMPMADMLAPTLKVEKIVLDKLRDNYNFMHVGKVDMCITCHVTISDPAYADWDDANEKPWHQIQGGAVAEDDSRTGQRVFNAHPRLDLFVSDKSPHPMGEFGCTTCHLGRGQAIEFERTFHTPTADAYETAHEKQERWVEEYGYDPARHYWDWPMTPSDKLYSSCYLCHSETDRIAGVPEYNESRELVEDLGCYGCHKIQGMEHLRKPGPDLTNVVTKLSPEWSRKWALSPQGFRATTRMPHFWHQSNSGAPADATINPEREWRNNSDRYVADWRLRNEVEARAIMSYVYAQSEQAVAASGFALLPVPEVEADPERGRELFEERGCLGCHALTAEDWDVNWHGPELSSIGSKVGPQWLYNWILEPKRYFPTSIMPDLRLGEDEAWDITAFLLEHRDETWEALPDAASDNDIVESIAVEYLSSVAGDEWAAAKVEEMRQSGGDAAVERYVGEKLFGRFGCAGCHLVPGHYTDMGIGTELTYEALKELTKFDFGQEASHANPEALHHSLPEWFERKLSDPRVYDRLPVVGENADGERVITHYEQKVKLPGEKLKMPNFYLEEHEVDLVVQFLLGLRDDGIDATMKRSLTADEALVEAGSRTITKFNCTGCHRVGQLPQRLEIEGDDQKDRLASLEELTEEGMDYGLWMAAPMTSGDVSLFAKQSWLSDEFFWPEAEETTDVFDFFIDEADRFAIPDHVDVFGAGEGGMGQYIEDGALRPPVLRAEGRKVQPDWLFDFLLEPYTVRTHVKVRMPTFGLSDAESGSLVRWFANASEQPWPFEVEQEGAFDQELYDEGAHWFNEVFQCNKCHPAGDQQPAEPDPLNWGPDLGLAKTRLKTPWIHAWLLEPPKFQPGTKMPNFFGEMSDGEYDPFFEDYQERIAALVHYLKYLKTDSGE